MSTLRKDYRGETIVRASFVGRDLRGFDFRDATLIRADFRGCDLDDVRFNGANLMRANFCDAIAPRATFTGAYLKRSDFTDADLRGASFARAIVANMLVDRAKLDHADFRDATCLRKEQLESSYEWARIAGTVLGVARVISDDIAAALGLSNIDEPPEHLTVEHLGTTMNVPMMRLIHPSIER